MATNAHAPSQRITPIMTKASDHETSAEGQTKRTKYYFAYGSNLFMRQMKRRCPNSKYVGFGRLPDFRWQINERGYANVVPSQGSWVDGLVYEIDDEDERQLDVSEGVSKGAYQKQHMPIFIKIACCSLYRRPVSWVVARGGPSGVRKAGKHRHRKNKAQLECQMSNVLVYISLSHVTDSGPKDEYIERINHGLKDAASLGMEDEYIRKAIRPFIPELSGNKSQASTRNNSPSN